MEAGGKQCTFQVKRGYEYAFLNLFLQILENDDFTSTTVRPGHSITGIYTHKIYYTKSKSPWALRKIFPDAAFVLHEECWNAFPYCKTVIKVGY